MLTLILGRAGTGKTSYVMNEFRRRILAGETGLIFLVPEQYSHAAERQLCHVCGDRLSLHGEVLSFSRLCGRVFAETGGAFEKTLDDGALLLVMHRALDSVSHMLRVFGAYSARAELLDGLLASVKEVKSMNMTPEGINGLAALTDGPLGDKLHDISLILGAYNAFLGNTAADLSDRLTRLAEKIQDSSIGSGAIYIDGFNDFTAQETRVIKELIKKNADLTLCLTCGEQEEEVFELSRKTAVRLGRLAEEYGVEVKTTHIDKPSRQRAKELVFLEKHLFGRGTAKFVGECGAVKIYSAPGRYAECEYAAARILELIRAGYRWRDIGVMARDWSVYGSICENVFEKYGIEYFAGGREDILEKPPVALIDAALDVITSNWSYKAVFKYLKTNLAGISPPECGELENYVLKWGIRGSLWTREGEWTLPPSGYGGKSARDDEILTRVNELRRRVTVPLVELRRSMGGTESAERKLRALYKFLEGIKLPERLEEKSAALHAQGELRLAGEYPRLWDIIINAMEQTNEIVGAVRLTTAEFRRLFALVLTKYSVGAIPVSLDRTALGDMAMNRRRDLKCLIVLGAADGSMPKPDAGGGIFSPGEREELSELSEHAFAGREERLCRELNMIYSTLTLPSDELILTYPSGENSRPSFIVKRLKTMLGIREITLREEEYMSSAPLPCFELAVFSENPIAAAARKYFAADGELPGRLPKISGGGRDLSPSAAEKLYGRNIILSATRIEKYYSCKFAHFLKSGLRLRPRIPAGFDAPEAGTFMHYILENVSRGIKETVGYKNADESLCRGLTARYIEEYVRRSLFDFDGRNERFIYLFRRLEQDVTRIALDMVSELKSSDFEPLNFELEITGGDMGISGFVDRVDGWRRSEGGLFIRVVDYKTGKKQFSLSDVLHGMGMQMLIYLFTLQKFGRRLYGEEVTPAGVLYVPARDFIIKAPRGVTEEELKKLREKELRRGGIILNDSAVLEAMENGESKRFLPVKEGKDGFSGESLVSAERLALLGGHVNALLKEAERGILGGNIACDPYYKNPEDNACLYCEYRAACLFDGETGGRRRYIQKRSADEVWEILGSSGGEDGT